jgi:hypothetical protein
MDDGRTEPVGYVDDHLRKRVVGGVFIRRWPILW